MIYKKYLLAALCLTSAVSLSASIRFGSRQAAIEIASTGSLQITNDATNFTKGTLRVASSGSIAGDAGEYLNCTAMNVETKYSTTTKNMLINGKLYLNDGTISLGNNDRLVVNGGTVSQAVTVNGATATPSIIDGHGIFNATVVVSDQKSLHMRWNGVMNNNIRLNPNTAATTSSLVLEDDLHFTTGGYGVTSNVTGGSDGTATVDFNGYAMHVGSMSFVSDNPQTWNDANVFFHQDITISTPITLTGVAGAFQGNGCKISFLAAGKFGGSVGGTISNAIIAGYSNTVLGSGSWTLRDVTFNGSNRSLQVLDGVLTGGTANLFSGSATFSSTATLKLLTDLIINGTYTFGGASTIHGNGHTIKVSQDFYKISFGSNDLTLSDISLTNIVSGNFEKQAGSNVGFRCHNVSFYDGSQLGAMRISPSPYVDGQQYVSMKPTAASSSFGGLFNQTLYFDGARISLLQNSLLGSGASWIFSNKTVLDGNGHTLVFGAGALNYDEDLYLTNVILGDVASGSFVNDAVKHLYMSNVTWVDNTTEGALLVHGSTEDTVSAAPAKVLLATTNSGNLFSTAVNWVNGVEMTLQKGITFNTGAAWTFTKSSIINGGGNFIDLNAVSGTTPMTVASGQTLTIANAVIIGWGASDIAFAGGTLRLVNCTVILDSNVTLGGTESLILEGATRFVTGQYIFDASAAGSNNQVNNVTIFYDTLRRIPANNVRLGSFSGSGRVAAAPLSNTDDVTFDATAVHVLESMFLAYEIDVSADGTYEARGRNVTFSNATGFKLRGNGRTFYMAPAPVSSLTTPTSTKLITVSGHASNLIELHDLVIDGWAQGHISDTNNLIRYCDGSVIRLQADQTLSTVLKFAVNSSTEDITIDLNGHDLDFASDSAALSIANIDATVRIKNGRLINVKNTSGGASKFLAGGATSSWVFQDVDILLADNAKIETNNVTFKGNCTVSGMKDCTFTLNNSTANIASGSRLTLNKGITFELTGTTSWAFGSINATLFLNGATLSTSSTPTFKSGALRVDDFVVLNGNMTLGSATEGEELEVDIMPAATLEISGGTITYANAS